MSNTDPGIGLPFSPFKAITRGVIDRLMGLIKLDRFTSIANGKAPERTVPEAISRSPTVHASMQSNLPLTALEWRGDSVKSSSFVSFLDFMWSRNGISIH
jgi:hypothetical protein